MIELRDLRRTYQKPNQPPVRALDGVSLTIERGEWLAILGPSGSGKSTLMNMLGLLDRPDSGDVVLDGRPVQSLPDDELASLRNRTIGFVFQSYHLLSRTTALENVELPLLYVRHGDHRQLSEAARAALAAVGLSDRQHHLAEELSGGQQQRVAIARAIVNRPALLLADEPTGNLDSTSAGEILDLFRTLHAGGTTVVVITHDETVAAAAQRVVRIRDGAIVSDERRIGTTPTPGGVQHATATAGAIQ